MCAILISLKVGHRSHLQVCTLIALQYDKEVVRGLPITAHMDRTRVTKRQSQIGFISKVLMPMFQEIAKVERIT